MPTEPVRPEHLTILNDNAGWCWFQNERAIIAGDQLYVGSVANIEGADSARRHGNIELTQLDLSTGQLVRTVLHQHLEDDDHDAPALHIRQDGRIVAVYTKHGSDPLMRYRVSERPGDICTMGPEQTLDLGIGICYSNVYRLRAENGRVYNFNRSYGWNPSYVVSDDDGLTWRHGGRLVAWTKPVDDPKYTGMDGGRPYARYASNGIDSVHVAVTEDHPRAYDNSLYHGIVRGGNVCASDGTKLAPLSTTCESLLRPSDLTCIYRGDAEHVAWGSDIRVDADGLPYVTFSVQVNSGSVRHVNKQGGEDIRYFYGRFDGQQWHVNEVAYGGHRLYPGEDDYSGLITLHPYRKDVVYFSTSADPKTGAPLISAADGQRHYELYRGQTSDGGKTWSFTALTKDSTVDNLRPIVPPGDPKRTLVIWCRGKLTTFLRYNLQAVMFEDSAI